MRIDFLANHTHLIEEIAKLKFLEFSRMVPEKPLEEFVTSLHEHCNFQDLPITYVALDGSDNFLGTFSLRECDLQSHKHLTPWIASVVVSPTKRNQGIGAILVERAEQLAQQRGYETLYLFTPNKAPWYTKLGWNRLESSTMNDIPITVMSKLLSK